MYVMEHNIRIGNYRVNALVSVKITGSVLNLAGTAVIVLASSALSTAKPLEEFIKAGDKVSIELGYDGIFQNEFEGYLKRISKDNGIYTLDCMDELYLLDKTIADREYKNATTHSLAIDWLKQAGIATKPVIDVNVTYDKFTTFKTTALEALKKIQDETKSNVYFAGGALHIHAPYSELSGRQIIFDTRVNIESSDLKYILASDKKIEINVVMTLPDGTKKEKKFGQAGGVTQTVTTTSNDLQGIAEREYNLWNYDGFEGSFTGWLLPFVRATDTVLLRDEDKPEGKYYVTGTEVEFSASGGKRKIFIGKKLG